MTKRTIQQIEESLRSKLAEAGSKNLDNDGVPDESQYLPGRNRYDPLNIGGRETGGPLNIDIGIGGAGSSKPRVTIDQARAARDARARAEQFLSGQGFEPRAEPRYTSKSSAVPPQQTARERLVRQAELARRGLDIAEPATIGDLARAVPGLTKTNMAGAALGGGLIGAGLGLKGLDILSSPSPSSTEQERAEWLKQSDARLEKSDQEQREMRQRIERDQKIADRLTAKRKQKAMKENKTVRTLEQIEQDLRTRLSEAGSKDLDNDGVPDEIQRSPYAGRDPYDPLNIGGRDRGFNIDIGIGGTGRGSGGRPSVWRTGPDGRRTSVPPPLRKPAMSPAEAKAAAAARKRAEELLTGQGFKEKEGPKVWRYGPDGKSSSQVPGGGGKGQPPGGKDRQPPMSAEPGKRYEIPGETAKEKRSAAYKSAGLHAAAALAAILGLKKDKDRPPAGGSEPGADSSGVTWVDTKDFVPTEVDAPETTKEPKPSAAVTREPSKAPEKPIQEPEIRLEPVKPSQKPDVTKPDEKPAEPEISAPRKEKKVAVPEPEPAPEVKPGPITRPTPGGSQGTTDTPSKRPKSEPGTTPDGRGTKQSVDGTGDQPGPVQGPDSGPGTGKEFKPDRSEERLMRDIWEHKTEQATQLKLFEKYKNFLIEDDIINEQKLTPRQTMEKYLGRSMSDSEYSALLRAVGAESGKEPLERAHVASVILNRTKAAKGDVLGVLNTPYQFQAITGPGGNQGSALRPYDGPKSNPNAKIILPGIDQEIASMLKLVPPGLMHFAAANPAAYRDVGGEKKYREVMKQYSKDPTRQRVFASVFGNLGPVDYRPGANLKAQEERKLGDKFKDSYAAQIPRYEPGYYTVGDSHGQGIAVYGKGKDGPNWINKSKVGASVVDPEQFKTHLANIESIPAGSVVTISGGANDIARPNRQTIVDNLNKMIAAARAKGHKVVYVLPTESPDPTKQAQREALRQTILKGLPKDVAVVDLGMASEKDKQKVHLDAKGYNKVANNIASMFKPGAAVAGEVPKTDTLTSADEQSILDRLKRTLPQSLGGKGELFSQVFGDREKNVAPGTATKKDSGIDSKALDITSTKTAADPRSFSVAAAVPLLAPAAALSDVLQKKLQKSSVADTDDMPTQSILDKEKRERDLARQKNLPMQVPAGDPDTNPKAWEEYSDYMEKRQVDAGEKFSRERAASEKASMEKEKQRLEKEKQQKQKNQPISSTSSSSIDVALPDAGKSAKTVKDQDVTKAVTQDQAGLVKAKRELSDFEQAFAAARARGAKEFTWQDKQGKPYQVATRLKGEKTSPETKTQSTSIAYQPQSVPQDIFKTPLSRTEPELPAASEIKQAIQDFIQQQAALDAREEIVDFDKLDDKIETINPRINAPGQNIDWKTIAPELFTTDKDNILSSTVGLKESINTQSNKDLLDILRLAGRR